VTTLLVKVGGEVVDDAAALAAFADNVAAAHAAGHGVVVVHGGGPQVTRLQERLGQKATKIAGQRVTGADDVYAVVSALCGTVNVSLCAALMRAGVRAFGTHGASVVRAHKRPPADVAGHGVVDYGEVGDVDGVDVDGINALVGVGVVPVVATLGLDRAAGRVLNINGDTAAAAVARALPAQVVILVTAVGGVFATLGDPASRLPRLTVAAARAKIADGTIVGGMIPKVDEALALVDAGVDRVAIVDAGPGAFVDVLAGADRGTQFCAERSAAAFSSGRA
jgi:acetylglutamate kinase